MIEERFPVCGTRPRQTIPMNLAVEAYAVYSRKYGSYQSLQRIGERGGFYEEELDEYAPGWRERLKT